MSGTPRYIPSRRSRFRQPDPDSPHRPPEPPPPLEPATEPVPETVNEVTAEVPQTKILPVEEMPLPSGEAPPEDRHAAPEGWLPEPEVPVDEADLMAPELPVTSPAAEYLPTETEELPQGFKLRNVYEGRAPMRRGLLVIYLVLGGVAMLGLGGALGYLIGSVHPAARTSVAGARAILASKVPATMTLSDENQAEVDTAFASTKEHRYADAQKQFNALYGAHPEWPSMGIESARATLYQFDAPATTQTLNALTRSGPLPDAAFLSALLHLTHKEFDDANLAFASAVALDPARPDFYYFWGDCLRTQGKPREAAQRFREAMLRNQYETAEDLYQLKFWLSLIQADQEDATGLDAQIDASLAVTPRPTYSAVFSAAARAIKKGQFKEAATFMDQGRQLTEPTVFQVIIQDPIFVQESRRPELAGFYRQP